MKFTEEFKDYKIKYNYIKKLLPRLDETQGLTNKQELKLRSCIMMFHSEIEVYLEKICFKILDRGLEMFKTKNKVLPYIAMLCLHCDRKEIRKFPTKKAIEEVIKSHKSFIAEKNHGIRREHIRNIFEPLGLNELYDQTILPLDFYEDLIFLSKNRGIAVHSSMKTFSDAKVMPSDILNKMNNINSNLQLMDNYLIGVLRSI